MRIFPSLRVEEAARILRISRTSAYELAHRWLATDGRAGLPVIRLGRSLRVPGAAIERLGLVGVLGEESESEVRTHPGRPQDRYQNLPPLNQNTDQLDLFNPNIQTESI